MKQLSIRVTNSVTLRAEYPNGKEMFYNSKRSS